MYARTKWSQVHTLGISITAMAKVYSLWSALGNLTFTLTLSKLVILSLSDRSKKLLNAHTWLQKLPYVSLCVQPRIAGGLGVVSHHMHAIGVLSLQDIHCLAAYHDWEPCSLWLLHSCGKSGSGVGAPPELPWVSQDGHPAP